MILNRPSLLLQHAANSLPDVPVVVHDEDYRRRRIAGRDFDVCRLQMLCRQQALDGYGEIGQLDGLVEL